MEKKNLIMNMPEPKAGILKRSDLFAIAVGMVIGSGMVTLIGPAMAYTGYSVWAAYFSSYYYGFLYGISVYHSWWYHASCRWSLFDCNEFIWGQCGWLGCIHKTGNSDFKQLIRVSVRALYE